MRKLPGFFVILASMASAAVFAQAPLLEEVRTVGAASAAVPVEHVVTVGAAGNYEIVLSDLGTPAAPLAAVSFAVTSGTTVLGTPGTAPGTLAFAAPAAGDYVVRVTGRPGSAPGSGLFRIQLRAAGSATVLDDFVNVLALPPGVPNSGQFVVDATFTVPVTGNYDVTLRDLAFPQSLTTLLMAVIEEGGPLVTALDVASSNPATANVAFSADKRYHVFAIAEPLSETQGGLYSMRIESGASIPFERTTGVAGVALLGEPTLSAGSQELVTADVVFPKALANLGAVVVRGGLAVATSAAAGTSTFTAVAGVHQVFGYAEPTVADGAGSLRVQVQPQGQPATFSALLPMTLPASGITPFTFDGAVVAGNYVLTLADYQFPAAFTSLGVAATQNGALLADPRVSAGTLNLSTAAGRVQLLVFARAAAAGSLFGLDVVPTAAGATAIETTQGVGRVFTARKVSVTSTARYVVRLTDVGVPANFGDLAAAVTRGSERVGLIFGSGTFDFSATPGNYFINIVANPATNQSYGTYGVAVTDKPPAPVITFSSNPARVTSGNTVALTWSVTNATGCTASNGWTGTKAVTGTETTAALTATSTFTLTCNGAGGNSTQALTVDVTPASGNGGAGGGGSFDALALLCLAALLFLQRRARRIP